jgi:hypothetical protein
MGDGGDLLPDLIQALLCGLYALVCGGVLARVPTHGPAPLQGVLPLAPLDLFSQLLLLVAQLALAVAELVLLLYECRRQLHLASKAMSLEVRHR